MGIAPVNIDIVRTCTPLGFFSFKKKIEDAVARAQMIASAALEAEEARRIEQEEVLLRYNLWDDPTRSSESLRRLSNATKTVNALKDLQYKVLCYHNSIT